jgi:uncharacterized membrane protein YkvA (DUF1232 family)
MLLDALIALAASLAALWLALAFILLVKRPDRATIIAASKLPGEIVSMTRALLRADQLPRGARVRLWILLVYLVSPIDLVPDFVPLIGYADDAIITAVLLRGTARSIGAKALENAWTGSEVNLAVLMKLCGIRSTGAAER